MAVERDHISLANHNHGLLLYSETSSGMSKRPPHATTHPPLCVFLGFGGIRGHR